MARAGGEVFGLARPDGTVLVEPMYDYITYAGDGLYSITLADLCGVMDAQGNVIVPPTYDIDTGGPPPAIYFWNGYDAIDDERTDRSLIIDQTGREVYTLPDSRTDPVTGETRYYSITAPLQNGCFWLYSWTVNREGTYPRQENFAYALMRIVEGEAIVLTEEIFDSASGYSLDVSCELPEEDFAEGLHPVRLNGWWGYIDENGAMAIPPAWDAASNFRNGLALVEKDGKLSYIDHGGAIVWREK